MTRRSTLIRTILGEGRTGWIYKDLVEEKRIAQGTEIMASFPGQPLRQPVRVFGGPRGRIIPWRRTARPSTICWPGFQSKPVDAETLARAKNVLRGRVTRILGSNQDSLPPCSLLLRQITAIGAGFLRPPARVRPVDRRRSAARRLAVLRFPETGPRPTLPARRNRAVRRPAPEAAMIRVRTAHFSPSRLPPLWHNPLPPRPRPPSLASRRPSAAFPSYNELKYPELRPIASPAIESVTLPNGMQAAPAGKPRTAR
jgi:hypothetical protein